jgi:hypothetical protein
VEPGRRLRGALASLVDQLSATAHPARMIEVISPAGFERFFREFVEMSDAGPPSREDIGHLAERYQLPFAQPDWLSDVIARYNLTPPPGA